MHIQHIFTFTLNYERKIRKNIWKILEVVIPFILCITKKAFYSTNYIMLSNRTVRWSTRLCTDHQFTLLVYRCTRTYKRIWWYFLSQQNNTNQMICNCCGLKCQCIIFFTAHLPRHFIQSFVHYTDTNIAVFVTKCRKYVSTKEKCQLQDDIWRILLTFRGRE